MYNVWKCINVNSYIFLTCVSRFTCIEFYAFLSTWALPRGIPVSIFCEILLIRFYMLSKPTLCVLLLPYFPGFKHHRGLSTTMTMFPNTIRKSTINTIFYQFKCILSRFADYLLNSCAWIIVHRHCEKDLVKGFLTIPTLTYILSFAKIWGAAHLYCTCVLHTTLHN